MLPDFKWDAEQPAKSYPFKDKEYKMTMGLSTHIIDDWLLMEDTYLDRIVEKTKLTTNTHPSYRADANLEAHTVFTNDIADPVVRELYDIVVQFMCYRYPMYFKVSEGGTTVHNSITNEDIPATAGDVEARRLLHYLVGTVEEDLMIMMTVPSLEDPEFPEDYFFKAGVFAFADGFDPVDKINRPMTLIHDRVPGYETNLRKFMNRYFGRLEVVQFVGRANYSIQAHDKLFINGKGIQLDEGRNEYEFSPEDLEYDFGNQVYYRSERQMLTRLPGPVPLFSPLELTCIHSRTSRPSQRRLEKECSVP